jgi:exopolysaccharide production protein ExoY
MATKRGGLRRVWGVRMRDFDFASDLETARADGVAGDSVYRPNGATEFLDVAQTEPQRPDFTDPFASGLVARATRSVGPVPLGGFAKRALDVVLASVALLLLAPLMLTVGVLIRVFLGGPVVFSQKRVGFRGRVFTCYKFRTMIVDAKAVLERHLAENPEAAREWKATRKLRNDPRITCLGRVLRKSSIDELPQLFNFLRGEMSLVGPRPVVAEELQYYGRRLRHYLKARPGLTGVWQTGGRTQLSYQQRVACDSFYVRNWSTRLDLTMLAKTIPALLSFDEAA